MSRNEVNNDENQSKLGKEKGKNEGNCVELQVK